jgi:nicotinamide mononucleotide (NMN) deamidase PncC
MGLGWLATYLPQRSQRNEEDAEKKVEVRRQKEYRDFTVQKKMDAVVTKLIEKIHAAKTPYVVAVTGGGSRAIADLLAVPGASNVLLEAVVPYAAAALDQFLGAAPESYCSEPTARAMAVMGLERARRLVAENVPLAGIGCTASLASDRPKRGEHRLHVALQTDRVTQSWSVTLVKGRRSREQEEDIVGRVVLAAMCGSMAPTSSLGVTDDEPMEEQRTVAPPAWSELYRGERSAVLAVGDSAVIESERRLIFPGAFHPRHAGHRDMAEFAARFTGQRVEHEISITNVDKPPLDFIEMKARASQFTPSERLWFTRAPTFREKAQIFAGATFVVGADTVLRIGEPRYYDGDVRTRDAAIARLAALGTRFLVFGRQIEGRYEVLSDLKLPKRLAALCEEVLEAAFRVDISSTDIRRG